MKNDYEYQGYSTIYNKKQLADTTQVAMTEISDNLHQLCLFSKKNIFPNI